MKVDSIVSADLSDIGNASGCHHVRWSIIVRICLLPELDVSYSMTRSMGILSNDHSRITVICSG